MRRLFFLLLLLGSPALHAEPGFISRLLNHPVPGGVAVVPLGSGAKAPAVRYQDKPVLVVQEDVDRHRRHPAQERARPPSGDHQRWPHLEFHGRHQALP